MLADGMLLVTRCLLISVHRSSVADLYALLADQLSLLMYCSLIATRLMVLLASRSWTYAALSILLLIDIHPHSRQLFSLKILVARRWQHDIYSTLLPSCYWQCLLTATSLLFAARLLFGCCFSLVVPLLSRYLPIAVHRSLAQSLLQCHWHYLLGAHGSFFDFFCFRLLAGPIAARSSWLIPSGLLHVTHFFKLASLSLDVGCSPISTTLASWC